MKANWIVLGSVLAAIACGTPSASADHGSGFNPPGSGAQNSNLDSLPRHVEVFHVPSKLLVEHGSTGAWVCGDSTSTYEIRLSVGHKMTVFMRASMYFFRGAERVEIGELGGDVDFLFHKGYPVSDLMALAKQQGVVQILEEYTLFEAGFSTYHRPPDPKEHHILLRGIAVGTYVLE